MTPRPTHILWDHDGVLVDTEPFYFEATTRALAEVGVRVARDEYLRYMARGQSLWDLARDAGVSVDRIAAHKAHRDRYYRQHLETEAIEIEGVEPVLETLGARFRMAIVTTARRADFELIHARRNIVEHMELVLTNGDYARGKPAPDPYLAALDRFGIGPEAAVVVEDSERGLKSALAAGIRCIVVGNPFTRSHDFTGAAGAIRSLTELPALLG